MPKTMKEQLDRAYVLIRDGQNSQAISLLEDIIRENPENEDAWWLLGNASLEPDARRNALNNVIRLSQNAERRSKAAALLNELERDPYNFSKTASADPARPLKSNNGCGRFALIAIGVLGLLACIGCVAFYNFALSSFQMPATFDDMGILEAGNSAEAVLNEGEIQAYRVTIEAGQRVRITTRANSIDSTPPFMFLFTEDGQMVAVSTETGGDYIRLEETIPESGDYLLVVRSFMGIGVGAYSIEYEILD